MNYWNQGLLKRERSVLLELQRERVCFRGQSLGPSSNKVVVYSSSVADFFTSLCTLIKGEDVPEIPKV